jgi:bifunctional ADP-heptose synthase (sugar kinase/adenylyltransferase)
LQLFKSKFSSSDVFEWIDKLATIEVNILGETIIDVYTECRPLAKSSKDPILAFQRYETRKFLGGVLAIAASCSEWAAKTRVFSACGEDFTNHLSEISKEIRFLRNFVELHDRPTIVKHRYVDKVSGNRIFEYYDFKPDTIGEDFQEKVIELLGELRQQKALLLLADYGHGFFGSKLIDSLFESNAFLSVNTQSNAGNRGFNTFSKYPRIDFLCLNGAELELELRKKDLNYGFVVPQIMNDKGCRYAVVTLGADGLLTFDSNGESCHTPALASRVVDKVGAGDSVLAVASMLAFLSAPKEIIGLLASVVAAFEVSQLGHANSISAVNMKKYVNGLLG